VRESSEVAGWQEVFEAYGMPVLHRDELVAAGASGRALTAAVESGHLVRLRNGHYCLPGCDPHIQRAVRIGGVLGCTSALASYGVFAYDSSRTHLHLDDSMSRLRAPTRNRLPLTPRNRGGAVLHWSEDLIDRAGAERHRVSVADALSQSLLCQHPWHALASIDNALHLGLVSDDQVHAIFRRAPQRLAYLEPLVDARAEAGQETVLRMLVVGLDLPYDLQVVFDEAGRVDILVAGCLVLEADSREAHEGWEPHVRDRGRDLALAKLGLASLRPAYQHTMKQPDLVRDAIWGLVQQQATFTTRGPRSKLRGAASEVVRNLGNRPPWQVRP
jgi:hypothetical protein